MIATRMMKNLFFVRQMGFWKMATFLQNQARMTNETISGKKPDPTQNTFVRRRQPVDVAIESISFCRTSWHHRFTRARIARVGTSLHELFDVQNFQQPAWNTCLFVGVLRERSLARHWSSACHECLECRCCLRWENKFQSHEQQCRPRERGQAARNLCSRQFDCVGVSKAQKLELFPSSLVCNVLSESSCTHLFFQTKLIFHEFSLEIFFVRAGNHANVKQVFAFDSNFFVHRAWLPDAGMSLIAKTTVECTWVGQFAFSPILCFLDADVGAGFISLHARRGTEMTKHLLEHWRSKDTATGKLLRAVFSWTQCQSGLPHSSFENATTTADCITPEFITTA